MNRRGDKMGYDEKLPDGTNLNSQSLKQQLKAAASLFQNDLAVSTLIESFAEAFLVIDETATVIMVNRRFVDLFGYTNDEIIGTSLDLLLPERFRKSHAEHVKAYFKAPHIRPMGRGLELRGQKKNGEEFPVEVSISSLQTETGNLGLAFITDITARSEAEQALFKQNQALSNFAETVAHDLKSLVTAITGFSELLEAQYENISREDRLMALGMVKDAGYKMSDIISELLLLARIRREDVVLETVDINDAVTEALKRLQWKVDSTRADIVVANLDSRLLGYQAWIEEVIYNLISNALNHGGESLTVRVNMEPAGEGYVRILISDNGRGMTDEQVRLLMEQPEGLPYSWVKGHGLGLTIVRQVLEKLGSTLEVSCEIDNGCRFSFVLPAQPDGSD